MLRPKCTRPRETVLGTRWSLHDLDNMSGFLSPPPEGLPKSPLLATRQPYFRPDAEGQLLHSYKVTPALLRTTDAPGSCFSMAKPGPWMDQY